ncbi:MAG: hypothetical protein FWF82_03355 [Oscillospiraceae bacterium]|nr:hypothetical protein [Oscillospiraceae bacterium]
MLKEHNTLTKTAYLDMLDRSMEQIARGEGKVHKLIDPDLFYSESNLAHLRRGVTALNDGKGIERDVIEVRMNSGSV